MKLSWLLVLLPACAGSMSAPESTPDFVRDYQVTNASAELLWERARDFLANAYGDSNEVLRVQDRSSTTLVGQGVHTWSSSGNLGLKKCAAYYTIRIRTKEERVRLVLAPTTGIPAGYTECIGFGKNLSAEGWNSMNQSFARLADELGRALVSGDGAFSDF